MNEQFYVAKFLLWAGFLAILLNGSLSLSKAAYQMAKKAIHAQTVKPLSYGKYSKTLWSRKCSRVVPKIPKEKLNYNTYQ
ncbi:MAG: hypothetical protein M9962_12520 [Oligoflexia bacterium]|nr:hypothetical protein [Oligoflexia bacterium]